MNRCPVFWLRSVSGSDRGPEVGGKLAIMPRQPVEHRPLATVDRTVGEPLAFGGFGLELFQFGLKVCHGSALPVFWERAKAGVLGLPLPRGPCTARQQHEHATSLRNWLVVLEGGFDV
jgi:hypothetical protein